MMHPVYVYIFGHAYKIASLKKTFDLSTGYFTLSSSCLFCWSESGICALAEKPASRAQKIRLLFLGKKKVIVFGLNDCIN